MLDERRYCAEKIETRAAEAGKPRVMFGHASVYDKRSKPIGGVFEEIMRRGCFDNVLRSINDGSAKDVTCSYWQHEETQLLATTLNGSLRLESDNTGLYQETDLLGDTQLSRDIIAHLDAGRINAMSFCFRASKDGQKWYLDNNRMEVREVLDVVRLKDVSPVTHPAYLGTDLAIRSEVGKALKLDRLVRLIIRAENGLEMSRSEYEEFKEFRALIESYVGGKATKAEEQGPAPLTLAEAKVRYQNLF